MIRFHTLLTLLLLALLLPLRAEAALSCTVSAPTMDFGLITTSPIPQTSVAPNLTINCTGGSSGLQRLCTSIDAGSTTGSSVTARLMNNGASTLQFQIYTDSAHATPWDTSQLETDVTLNGAGAGTVVVPMYGLLPNPPAQSGPSGTYSTTLGVSTKLKPGGSGCGSGSGSVVGTGSFAVQVILGASCTISASTIDFGTLTSLTSTQNSSGSLGVNCSSSSPYTIAMSAGTIAGNTIAARKMGLNGAGAGVVSYQLYRDGYGTTLWGDGTTGSTYVGTGAGSLQSIPVYAQMPIQTTPPVGIYKDTVTATITY